MKQPYLIFLYLTYLTGTSTLQALRGITNGWVGKGRKVVRVGMGGHT